MKTLLKKRDHDEILKTWEYESRNLYSKLWGLIVRKERDQSVMKIDAHQHFWIYNEKEYSWISEDMSELQRDFLPEDLERTVTIS